MSGAPPGGFDPTIADYYERAPEEARLAQGPFQLEELRTRELIRRFALPPPATVVDVGGAAGAYALWLAQAGYSVHLLDPVPRLVAEAQRRSAAAQHPLASCRIGDARTLDIAPETADVVLLLGPLYHLTEAGDRARALREAARILKPDGRAIVMLYHRGSYNYRIGIRVLRRAGAGLLKSEGGIKIVHSLTGEPIDSLREHARLAKANGGSWADDFLSQSTDGAGNPLARVYSRREARDLFRDFRKVELRAYFLNKRFIPLIGNLLPRSIESALAARWGWHLWIYATK